MAQANAREAFQMVVDSICPPAQPAQEEPRDYLAEARRILSGSSLLMAQHEHLVALRDFYESSEYTDEVVQNILGGEAAAADYVGDLL